MKCVRHICYNVTNNQNVNALVLAHSQAHTCHANAQQIDFSFDFEYNMCTLYTLHTEQAAYAYTLQTKPPPLLLIHSNGPELWNSHQSICIMQVAMHLISDLFSICIIFK